MLGQIVYDLMVSLETSEASFIPLDQLSLIDYYFTLPQSEQAAVELNSLPEIILSSPRLLEILQNNNTLMELLDSLTRGQEIAEILAGVEKGPEYLSKIKTWLRYFLQGKEHKMHPLSRIVEDLCLARFMNDVDIDRYITSICWKISKLKWKKSLLNEQVLSRFPQSKRRGVTYYFSDLRFFLRMGFILTVQPCINGNLNLHPRYLKYLPESFSAEDFLFQTDDGDNLISDFYQQYFDEFKVLPKGFRDFLFRDWTNYPDASNFARWKQLHSGFYWSNQVVRHSTAAAKRLIYNLYETPTSKNWKSILVNRKPEIKEFEDLLRVEIKKYV